MYINIKVMNIYENIYPRGRTSINVDISTKYKRTVALQRLYFLFGTPNGNRTHDSGMRSQRLNRLTMRAERASFRREIHYIRFEVVCP